MNTFRHKKTPLEITLTPMIDVVFLLLIFFMVTTTFNQRTELGIDLPARQVSESTHTKTEIKLIINAKGIYFMVADDGKPQLSNHLATHLKHEANRHPPHTPLIISADKKTPYQAVFTALDTANSLGFSHISFAAQPQEAP